MNRTQRLAAAAATTVLAVGAVGIALTIAPANADQDQRPATAAAPAALQATQANISAAAPAAVQGKAKGSTVVAFDPAALTALAPLSPTAISPGTFTLSGDTDVRSAYPIVGNTRGGIIRHVGGLTLTDGPNTVTLLNYEINTNTRQLSATAFQNGKPLGKVPFLTLTPAAAAAGCDASAGLALSPATAFVLSDAFGVGDLSGATIGTACVDLR